jgi:hypothetical protein
MELFLPQGGAVLGLDAPANCFPVFVPQHFPQKICYNARPYAVLHAPLREVSEW